MFDFIATVRREMCGNVQQGPTRKRSKVKATQFSMSSVGKSSMETQAMGGDEYLHVRMQVPAMRLSVTKKW